MPLLALLAAATAAPLTFGEALAEALDRAPAVAIAEAEQQAAFGEAQRARSWSSNPEAALERDAEGQRLSISAPIPINGQPIARARLGHALHDSAEISGALGRVQAVLDVGRAYLQAERDEQLAQLANDTLALAERNRDAARKLLDVNEISVVDAVALAAVAARAVQEATLAQQQALQARLTLEILLGRPPTGETTPTGWPDLRIPEQPSARLSGRLSEGLPRAILAAASARAARASALSAQLEQIPTPVLAGGWEQQEDRSGLVAGVAVQIPLVAPGLGTARSARAEAERAEAESRRADLWAAAQWMAATSELDAARTAYAASQLDGLETALEAIAAALASGEYSLAEYTARRDALVDGRTIAIEARYRLEIARLALWELLGELPPGIL